MQKKTAKVCADPGGSAVNDAKQPLTLFMNDWSAEGQDRLRNESEIEVFPIIPGAVGVMSRALCEGIEWSGGCHCCGRASLAPYVKAPRHELDEVLKG